MTLKRTAIGIVAMFVSTCGVSGKVSAAVLADNFNRADGSVGNGWINASDNASGNLVIQNGALTIQAPNGQAGIVRGIENLGGLSAAATITYGTGFGGELYRYDAHFLYGNAGDMTTGYDLLFYRGGQAYANSSVALDLNGVRLADITSSFQFQTSIDVAVTFDPDGSVVGTVSAGSNIFSFAFGARVVTFSAANFGIAFGFPDRTATNLNPTLDNLVLTTSDTAAPEPASLLLIAAGLGLAGLRRGWQIRRQKKGNNPGCGTSNP